MQDVAPSIYFASPSFDQMGSMPGALPAQPSPQGGALPASNCALLLSRCHADLRGELEGEQAELKTAQANLAQAQQEQATLKGQLESTRSTLAETQATLQSTRASAKHCVLEGTTKALVPVLCK